MTGILILCAFCALLVYLGFTLGARYESRRIHKVMLQAWERKNDRE